MFPGNLLGGPFGRASLLLIRLFVFARGVYLIANQLLALSLLENAFNTPGDLFSLFEMVGVELGFDSP